MSAATSTSTDATLRASITEGDARTRATVVLDPRFQGLPDTAHGGTVLALFDALCQTGGERAVGAIYHRRVPLDRPLQLAMTRAGATSTLTLSDGASTLVTGTSAAPPPRWAAVDVAAPARDGATPLPLSMSCFACGTANPLGLRARLSIDERAVGGTWDPPPALRAADGTLATVALTGLLDEAAFWLGAAASGESGMTTDLRVTLHASVPFGRRVVVAGARGVVRARADDPRYWDTSVEARDDRGALVAEARITFVAVRGAARKLAAGLLVVNPPDVVRAIFPAYVR